MPDPSRLSRRLSSSIAKARAVEEKLVHLLPTVKVLQINPAGEMFGSKPSRKLLEMIDDERCPQLVLDIISNGTLFTERNGTSSRASTARLDRSASRSMRRAKRRSRNCDGWGATNCSSRICASSADLRANGMFPQLKFSFTYQLDNFREMPEFVEFCAEMNADFAIFERLQEPGLFRRRLTAKRRCITRTIRFIGNSSKSSGRSDSDTARVRHDFDYDGVDNNEPRRGAREISRGSAADRRDRMLPVSFPGNGAFLFSAAEPA